MTTNHQDKFLLGAALAAAIGSFAWFGFKTLKGGESRSVPAVTVKLSTAPYVPAEATVPNVKTETWEAPPPQRRGHDWVYDVFTPPTIFYDARSKEFSVAPPVVAPVVEGKPAASRPFGLELLAVKRPLFRLQLVGYVGGEDNYRGLFENALTTETFLAAGGREVPALELTIERFEVRRMPVPLPDSMTTNRLVAIAVVCDKRTGETVALTSAERRSTTAPVATVAATDAPGQQREVCEGETVELAGTRFKILRIRVNPPAVDVAKESADQTNSEPRTLTAPPPGPLPAT